MVTALPVPIQFELPAGWHPVPPDDAGAPGAAFVAVYPDGRRDGFTPNITISGEYRQDSASLSQIADESVDRFRAAVDGVSVAKRAASGTVDAPGLTQFLSITKAIDGRPRDLTQCQAYLVMPDVHQPSHRAVVELALTVASEQLAEVIDDFQRFVTSVGPDVEGGAGDGDGDGDADESS